MESGRDLAIKPRRIVLGVKRRDKKTRVFRVFALLHTHSANEMCRDKNAHFDLRGMEKSNEAGRRADNSCACEASVPCNSLCGWCGNGICLACAPPNIGYFACVDHGVAASKSLPRAILSSTDASNFDRRGATLYATRSEARYLCASYTRSGRRLSLLHSVDFVRTFD